MIVLWCEVCSGAIEIKPGRRPKYCSDRCRKRAQRERDRKRKAPQPLAEVHGERRWVRADGKRPIMPCGSPASSTDPATWSLFSDVQAGEGDGYGFMLGDGFACIDLDGCFINGQLQQWARRIVDAAPGAFIERSVSGNGLHIFGLLPEDRGRKYGCVEVYSNARFIRTTSDVWAKGNLVNLSNAALTVQAMSAAGELPKKS